MLRTRLHACAMLAKLLVGAGEQAAACPPLASAAQGLLSSAGRGTAPSPGSQHYREHTSTCPQDCAAEKQPVRKSPPPASVALQTSVQVPLAGLSTSGPHKRAALAHALTQEVGAKLCGSKGGSGGTLAQEAAAKTRGNINRCKRLIRSPLESIAPRTDLGWPWWRKSCGRSCRSPDRPNPCPSC